MAEKQFNVEIVLHTSSVPLLTGYRNDNEWEFMVLTLSDPNDGSKSVDLLPHHLPDLTQMDSILEILVQRAKELQQVNGH